MHSNILHGQICLDNWTLTWHSTEIQIIDIDGPEITPTAITMLLKDSL